MRTAAAPRLGTFVLMRGRPVPVRHGGQATEQLCPDAHGRRSRFPGGRPWRVRRRRENARVSGEHYFSASPQAPARPTEVDFEVAGRDYRLRAAAGSFSASRLDPGTAVLLRKARRCRPPRPRAPAGPRLRVRPDRLRAGHLRPAATVYAVDVNARALRAGPGQRRRARPRRPGRRVRPGRRTGGSWGSPRSGPTRRSGSARTELHAHARCAGCPGWPRTASAWLVVAEHLGGDSLHGWLQRAGVGVERHASQQGFRVLRVTPAKQCGRRSPAPAPQNS